MSSYTLFWSIFAAGFLLLIISWAIVKQIKGNAAAYSDPTNKLKPEPFPKFLERIIAGFQPRKKTASLSPYTLERKKGVLFILITWLLVSALCSMGYLLSNLVRNGEIRSIPKYVALLDGERRDEMVAKLVKLGGPAVEPLIAAYHGSVNTRVRLGILEAIRSMQDTKAIDPLVVALQDDSPSIRLAAIGGLDHTITEKTNKKDSQKVLAPLVPLLEDADPAIRADAAGLLGFAGKNEVVELLIPLLQDADVNVRKSVAQTLVEIGDHRAENALMELFAQRDLAVIASIPAYYIRRASSGDEYVFQEALLAHGNPSLAALYINCGNADLASYGQTWAESNGYEIVPYARGEYAEWGSMK